MQFQYGLQRPTMDPFMTYSSRDFMNSIYRGDYLRFYEQLKTGNLNKELLSQALLISTKQGNNNIALLILDTQIDKLDNLTLENALQNAKSRKLRKIADRIQCDLEVRRILGYGD